ncbi:VOC family protein [Poseidonocella sp. HB161398]|uniref:VOC family protein n=1 Tax=Poseidonocella sp. HB161398 TaxID=2320855 RepID=UPI00197F82F2|nr:VOC family protein [Poseidonocella sp. HB161398]
MAAFCAKVLAPVELVRRAAENGGPLGRDWPQIWLKRLQNGAAASTGNGSQAGFDAPWQAAVQTGGTDKGPPGPRPHHAPDDCGADCRDPEGSKPCFVLAAGFAARGKDTDREGATP